MRFSTGLLPESVPNKTKTSNKSHPQFWSCIIHNIFIILWLLCVDDVAGVTLVELGGGYLLQQNMWEIISGGLNEPLQVIGSSLPPARHRLRCVRHNKGRLVWPLHCVQPFT